MTLRNRRTGCAVQQTPGSARRDLFFEERLDCFVERARVSARRSAPSKYTGVSPVAQYSVSIRFGCVVSRGVRNRLPPSIGTNSIHPCHVLPVSGPPDARAS
jgi:hypothetical protein